MTKGKLQRTEDYNDNLNDNQIGLWFAIINDFP